RTPNKEEEGKRRTGDSPSFSQPTPALQAPTRRLWTTPNQSQQPDQHPHRSRTQRTPTNHILGDTLPARAKPERRTNQPPPRAPHPQRPRERHPRHRQRIPEHVHHHPQGHHARDHQRPHPEPEHPDRQQQRGTARLGPPQPAAPPTRRQAAHSQREHDPH